MRILFVSQDYPPAVGGIETYSWEIARRLSHYSDHLTIVAPATAKSDSVDSTIDATSRRIAIRPDLLPLPLLARLPRLASRQRFDVSFHSQWQTAVAALLARALTGFPRRIVVAAHGRELLFNPYPSPADRAYDALRRSILRRADMLLPVSRYTAGLLRSLGADPRRITVVNNGTDPDRFKPTDSRGLRTDLGLDGRRVILTVTRLVGRKGVDTVIEALPAVVQQFPNATYLIIGDGPERSALETMARRVGPDLDIRFLGRIDYEILPAYYSLADFAVMPSRNEPPDVEGFGIVFLEANACGCPVIGARSGGIPDAVVDGETGILVPPADPGALASAMVRLLGDEQLRKKLGANGRERTLASASWDHVATRIWSVLATVEEDDRRVGFP